MWAVRERVVRGGYECDKFYICMTFSKNRYFLKSAIFYSIILDKSGHCFLKFNVYIFILS